MHCVCNGRVAPLPTTPDLRNFKSRSFVLTQFLKRKEMEIIQGGSNMTGTDLCVNKPHCAAAVRP